MPPGRSKPPRGKARVCSNSRMEQRLEWLQIGGLDLEARGVGRSENGKVVFVANALPGERVQARIMRSKRNWESGQAVAWATTSPFIFITYWLGFMC